MNILVKHLRSDSNCRIYNQGGTSQPKLTKEGPSGEGKDTVIKTNVVMDPEAMSGLRDPSVYLGFSEHGHNANEIHISLAFQRHKGFSRFGRKKRVCR